jgi:hypothetical protein
VTIPAPELISPVSGEIGVSFVPTLEVGAYAGTAAAHAWTGFKICTDAAMEDVVFSMRKSSGDLSLLTVPDFVLNGTTEYYWSARFADEADNTSAWATASTFTTIASEDGNNYADLNKDGIPDAQEVEGQAWAVHTAIGGAIKRLEAGKNVGRFFSLKAVGPSRLSGLPSNRTFPIGFIAFGLTCQQGAEVTVNVHLSKAAPANAQWYFYDQVAGVVGVYSKANFNAARTMVELTLKDGGIGDVDGEENGVILDPSGYGIPKEEPVTEEGAGDDNCFITTAGGSAPHTLGSEPSLMLMLLMALGAVLFVRRVRK